MNNQKEWPHLAKPPVIMAVFQMRYSQNDIDISAVASLEREFKEFFPIMKPMRQSNIDILSPPPLGISKISANANTTTSGYVFLANEQKRKLSFEVGKCTYADEMPYSGWEQFKEDVLRYLHIASQVFDAHPITGVSIRFINRFPLPEFNNPTEYFNTLVSTTQDSNFAYPITRYGFKIQFSVPETNIYSIVNQEITPSSDGIYYFLDIDVLDNTSLIFDEDLIGMIMDKLRAVKNNIFFENLTKKTLDLCN